MIPRISNFAFAGFAVSAGLTAVLAAGVSAVAQDSDVNLSLHVNSRATAATVGVPVYPGATLEKKPDSDSAVDLGVVLGSFHLSVIAASYVTSDSPAQVLDYYRKPLSRYGEVLECNHGKPVGPLAVTPSGLTCTDQHGGGHLQVNANADSSEDHELRAGSPQRYRIVAIDKPESSHPEMTRFGLVALELPKDEESK